MMLTTSDVEQHKQRILQKLFAFALREGASKSIRPAGVRRGWALPPSSPFFKLSIIFKGYVLMCCDFEWHY